MCVCVCVCVCVCACVCVCVCVYACNTLTKSFSSRLVLKLFIRKLNMLQLPIAATVCRGDLPDYTRGGIEGTRVGECGDQCR